MYIFMKMIVAQMNSARTITNGIAIQVTSKAVLEPMVCVRSAFDPRRYLIAKKMIRKQMETEKKMPNANSEKNSASTSQGKKQALIGKSGKSHIMLGRSLAGKSSESFVDSWERSDPEASTWRERGACSPFAPDHQSYKRAQRHDGRHTADAKGLDDRQGVFARARIIMEAEQQKLIDG